MRTLFAVVNLFFSVTTSWADLTGKARVIDGDTIEIDGDRSGKAHD